MASQQQIAEARVRLAFLLRSMFRRVDSRQIGADRYRNLGNEMADALRAITIASRSTMEFITSLARRFGVELNEGSYEEDGEARPRRVCAAFIPEDLAGDLAGHDHDGLRVVTWAVLAQATPLDAVRIVVHDGPDFFVTFAQTKGTEHDRAYFKAPEVSQGRRWSGVIPGEDMQSPKQHRAWFQVVSPLAHGHDEKAGNVVLFRRQLQVDPWTGTKSLVPIYTGNAVKGQWRDLFFARMLRAVGVVPEDDLSQRRAQELFAGGTIESGADTGTARLDVRRKARRTIPAIDLVGGCIEQQIMSGILKVSDCTLLCRENAWKLFRIVKPTDHNGAPLSYEEFAQSLSPSDDLTLLRLGVRQAHRDLPGGDLSAKKGGAQMLWNTEAILPGARFLHTFSIMSLSNVSQLALSCMSDLLADFADNGFMGAQTARGYGQVSTIGYFPAEKATPLPPPDVYLTYLKDHRSEIVDWVMGSEPVSLADLSEEETPAPPKKERKGRKNASAGAP